MKKKDSIWTKTFISLSFTNLSVFIIFYGLISTLPLYAIGFLERTDQEAGLLISIFLLSAIIFRPLTGMILEKYGKRKMLWISLILYVICTVLYNFIEVFSWLLALRFLHGIWFSIATTACGAIAADIVPATRRGAGLGYFMMSTNLAMVLGPFIGLSLIQVFSFDLLFIILSILMTIGALLALFIPSNKQFAAIKTKRKRKLSFHDFFEKRALPVAFLASLIGLSYASILSYISIYAQQKGLLEMTSPFFIVFAAVMLIARPFTGKIYDEKGPQYILYPGLTFFFLGLILLAYMNSPITFLLSGAFIGLGYGSILPSLQTLAVQSTTINRSGYATATFYTFFDTGIAVGSYILGVIAISYRYQTIYLLSGGLVAIVFLLVFLMRKNRKKEVAKGYQNRKTPIIKEEKSIFKI